MTPRRMKSGFAKISELLRRAATSAEEIGEGAAAVATPPPGAQSARLGDPDRETSTNAQMEGAADEPWGGNR